MMSPRPLIALLAALMLIPPLVWSADAPSRDPGLSVEALADHQWGADIDGGGSFSLDETAIRVSLSHGFTNDVRLGLNLGYGETWYDFNRAGAGLGAQAPWSSIRTARVGISLNSRIGERWTLFAVPSLRWAAEHGASLDDGAFGGVMVAASYRFSDRLSIGPGFGAFAEIEDDTSVFPLLAVDWRITDTLSLRTGGGLAATRGPGVLLEWRPSEPWTLSLGARYEKERFRLDDQGAAVDGVGQDRSVPVFFAATRNLGASASLSLIAGAKTRGNLRLEDARGKKIDAADYETAPFAGGAFKLRF
jgi:hypothetical protein